MIAGTLFAQENVDILQSYIVKSIDQNNQINQFVIFNIENAITGEYIDIDESYVNIDNGLITLNNPELENTPNVTCYEVSGGIYVVDTNTDEEINNLMVGDSFGNANYSYLYHLDDEVSIKVNGIENIRSDYLHTGLLFFTIDSNGYLEENDLFVNQINDPDSIIESTENFEIYEYFECFQIDFVNNPYWQNKEASFNFDYNEMYFWFYTVLHGNFIELDYFNEIVITRSHWESHYQSYLVDNETTDDIEISSLGFNLNYNNWQGSRTLFPETLILYIGSSFYEFDLPEDPGYFTAEIDYILSANSAQCINYAMVTQGYGWINIGLFEVIVNENQIIYPNISIDHQVVNMSEPMHELYSSATNLEEEYGNGYGGIEVNMFPGQIWEFNNGLDPVWENFIENTVTWFTFTMEFHEDIENYHWFWPWTEDFLDEHGELYPLQDNDEIYQGYWASDSTHTGITNTNLLRATITNNIIPGSNAHLEGSLHMGNYMPNYGPQEEYDYYSVEINSVPGTIGDIDGDQDSDNDDLMLNIEHTVNHTLYNTEFNGTNEVNIARGTFMFYHQTGFDPWLQHQWIVDPNNPMVVGIGFGLEYEYDSGFGRFGEGTDWEGSFADNTLTIETTGNGVSVKYFFNGQWITDSILLDNGEVLRFDSRTITADIEPIRYNSTRDNEFIFDLPEGYQNLEISAIITPEITTSTEPEEIVPVIKSQLIGNYPNPFNPETKINFNLAEEGKVELVIYNTKGQKVKTLVKGSMESGQHNVVWSGKDDNGKKVSSGVYLYKMHAGGRYTSSKKMILLK